MHVSARSDYAVRAMLSVAADPAHLAKAADLAADQAIPLSFLQGSCSTCVGPGSCTASVGSTAATHWPGPPRRSRSATSSGPSAAR
ncbi:hypothetical protein [Polymorphospora rubra]|uniref:hypothetical protein n=1 Tax=Polymorphospora rubra TaxID=338584 RepID=UPI003CCEF704